MDLQEEVERRAEELYTPNWFSVELKTGVGGEGEGEEGRGVAGETCACGNNIETM